MSRRILSWIWQESPVVSLLAAALIFLFRMRKIVVNIFIYAPYKARLENCIHSLEMSEDEAKRMIMKVDKARLAYHKKYAGYTPYDPLHKHLMIDSSLWGSKELPI